MSHPPADDALYRVWLAYCDSTGRNGGYRLDAVRRRKIIAALAAYPEADVLDAVRGWRHVPWNAGANPSKRLYNDLGLLLRDAEHIERFRDAYRGAQGGEPEESAPQRRMRAARELVRDALRDGRQPMAAGIARGFDGYEITRAFEDLQEESG